MFRRPCVRPALGALRDPRSREDCWTCSVGRVFGPPWAHGLFTRAREQRAREHLARYLGVWAYALDQARNINCYIFGGEFTAIGELLFGPARAHFDRLDLTSLPVLPPLPDLIVLGAGVEAG